MRQGKSVDVFSFGLVLFYCLTGGKHAFGESYERDFNIMQVPNSSFRFLQIELRALLLCTAASKWCICPRISPSASNKAAA